MDRTTNDDGPAIGDEVRVPGGTVGQVVNLADRTGNPTPHPTHAQVSFGDYASWIPIGSVRVLRRADPRAVPNQSNTKVESFASPAEQERVSVLLLRIDGLLGTQRLVETSVVAVLEESFGIVASSLVPKNHPARDVLVTSQGYDTASTGDYALAELAAACHHARRLVVKLANARRELDRRRDQIAKSVQEG